MFAKDFKIDGRKLSKNTEATIIAEVGINHEGNFSNCIKLVAEANKSGADLVKLQIADPDSSYEKNTLSYKIFKKSLLTKEEIFNIYKFCKKKKIKIFSTFDKKSFEFFSSLNQICYKISSSLFYDFYFIKKILKTGKPLIISTGLSDLDDIDALLKNLLKENNKKIAMLHCVSSYPTEISKVNLSRIEYIKSKYGIITGFSDHTLGIDAAAASVHYGAKIIEKHFTLNNSKKNFDHKISLNPNQFKEMVEKIRNNEKMIGEINQSIFQDQKNRKNIKKYLRQFKLNNDIKKNSILSEKDFSLVRLKNLQKIVKFSSIIERILKKRVSKNLKKNTLLSPNVFKK